MRPTREPRVTLDDLVEVLLNKGAVLHLDLIVAVADIPLIGVSVRAAIAGMETMLEYGMMRNWDEATRQWAERSAVPRGLGLREDESVVRRMGGGHLLTGGVYHGWRTGTVYLTDQRLVVLRDEPREVLWQTDLDAVRDVRLRPEETVGGEERLRLEVALADGRRELLSAREPETLHDLLTRSLTGRLGPSLSPGVPEEEPPLADGHLWYEEPRRSGPMWRGGRARLTADRLTWKSPVDGRPALVLSTAELAEVSRATGYGPGGEGSVLLLRTVGGDEYRLSADDPAAWIRWFESVGRTAAPA